MKKQNSQGKPASGALSVPARLSKGVQPALEKLAADRNFRGVFPGAPDIEGRYSALSNFGMAPAALIGLDITDVLDRAERAMEACGPEVPADENPGLDRPAKALEAAVAKARTTSALQN